jgi:hypothetical protein
MNLLNEKVAFGLFEDNTPPAELLSAGAEEINAMQ